MAFFSISTSQPLLSQFSLRRRESREFRTMGQALGIPDSGLLAQNEPISAIDTNEPLDKLLLNKRFRQSFMAFADRLKILLCVPDCWYTFKENILPKWQFSTSLFHFLMDIWQPDSLREKYSRCNGWLFNLLTDDKC